MKYTQKLKDLDLREAINFLSDQSISFGNKTVVCSAFIILLSLNFIAITGIEIEGVSFSVNVVIITIVLLLVNLYYYQQFMLHSSLDQHLEYSPKLLDLLNDSNLLVSEINNKFKIHASRKENIAQTINKGPLADDEFESLLNENNQIDLDIIEFRKNFEESVSEHNRDIAKYNKYESIKKKSTFLNVSIPKLMFYLGNLAVILRFVIYTSQIFYNEKDPLKYMWEDNIKYYKVIFENNSNKNKTAP